MRSIRSETCHSRFELRKRNRWTLEALDWETGREAFHYVLGGARFNGFFSGVVLDPAGRPVLGAPFGKFRIERPGP